MNSCGEISGEVNEFQHNDRVFRVCLAKEPVNSNDRFFFHKTTRREIYNQAKIQGFDEVILFNEKGESTEFTIGNLVVKMDGKYYTPPIECGLLAGTFRAELIASGQVEERIIPISDLHKYEEIFLVNSLRKWVKVQVEAEPPNTH